MGTYNQIRVEVDCPRCGASASVVVDAKFGDTTCMISLNIGDRYPWLPRKAVHNGGRPPDGNLDGEGYTECSVCGKDYFLTVIVRDDIITAVQVDRSMQGYLPD